MSNDNQDILDSYFPGNEIFTYINKLKTGYNAPSRNILLLNNSKLKLIDLLKSIQSDEFKFTVIKENDFFILWNIESVKENKEDMIKCPNCGKEILIDPEERIPLKNFMLEHKETNLLVYISNDKIAFDKIIKFFNFLYPLLNRIFYNANDIKTILDKIAEKNFNVVGREYVSKRLYGNKTTEIYYHAGTIEDFYNEAKKQKTWVDSLEVNISKLGTIRLSRKGEIQYSKPFNFSGFFEIVVKTIFKEILIKRRELYKTRSRTENSPIIKPLNIFFENEIFSKKESIIRLIERLNRTEKYELSVLYLADALCHIELFDYANGSSFDLFINSVNQLTIVPQTQVTNVALESLVLRINDVFEGRIQ